MFGYSLMSYTRGNGWKVPFGAIDEPAIVDQNRRIKESEQQRGDQSGSFLLEKDDSNGKEEF